MGAGRVGRRARRDRRTDLRDRLLDGVGTVLFCGNGRRKFVLLACSRYLFRADSYDDRRKKGVQKIGFSHSAYFGCRGAGRRSLFVLIKSVKEIFANEIDTAKFVC